MGLAKWLFGDLFTSNDVEQKDDAEYEIYLDILSELEKIKEKRVSFAIEKFNIGNMYGLKISTDYDNHVSYIFNYISSNPIEWNNVFDKVVKWINGDVDKIIVN